MRERFQRWQGRFDEHEPWAPEKFGRVSFDEEELKLTQALKREVGDEIYVECHALEEMLMDGTTTNWRTILGVPDVPIQRESK